MIFRKYATGNIHLSWILGLAVLNILGMKLLLFILSESCQADLYLEGKIATNGAHENTKYLIKQYWNANNWT